MKVHYVEVNVGKTVNIGNFESVRAEVRLGATLDHDDKVTEVRRALNIQAAQELDTTLKNMIQQVRS